jgi:hypothetical protein
VRAGLRRRRAVRGGPHHLESHTSDGVLDLGDVGQALRHHVAVAQGCELATGTADDGGVACELEAGDGARGADVLEEHLHAEVHGDVAPAGVFAATEQ